MKPTTVEFTVAQNDLDRCAEAFSAFNGRSCRSPPIPATTARSSATGTLYAISNQMTTSTGTVTLRATFANDDEALFPNEFVNIKMLVDTLPARCWCPTPAVLSGAPGDYVYLVNADQTVSVHKVTLGPSDGRIPSFSRASRSATRSWSTVPTA
jgi:multidrug efflux system membrane fusion protein